MAESRAASIEVTFEDQQNINEFGKLNNKKHQIEGEVDGYKKSLEDLEDAENELMLSDESEALYVVGECFVHFANEEAEERINTFKEEIEADVAKKEAELEMVVERMAELKTVLYGKFGKSINLEE